MNPVYLKQKNPHPRDKRIKFYEGPHLYTVDGVGGYTSVTSWNHSHFAEFNADKIIVNMMNSKNWNNNKYYGMTALEIKEKWDKNGTEASAAGTKMHFDIECFYNKLDVKNDSIEFTYFKQFHKDYSHLVPYRTEWEIFHEDLLFSGSIDGTFVNQDGDFELYDWKRCKEIPKDNRWQHSLTPCISHLPDSKFWHYALQLNIYKAILEDKYDKKIAKMCLVCLHPNNKNCSYLRYEVPNLSKEIKELFLLRSKQVMKLKQGPDQITLFNSKLDETNYKIKKLYDEKNELIDKLSILDSNFEEKFEVDVLYYEDKEYLVDPYRESGDLLGVWYEDKPKLF